MYEGVDITKKITHGSLEELVHPWILVDPVSSKGGLFVAARIFLVTPCIKKHTIF